MISLLQHTYVLFCYNKLLVFPWSVVDRIAVYCGLMVIIKMGYQNLSHLTKLLAIKLSSVHKCVYKAV